jgi:tRNA pseudouridine13 synthase
MALEFPELDLNLPYITEDHPGIGGKIRQKTSHFIVEEIPLYTPSGEGKHLYINITKENLTTREVQLRLADLFKLKPEEIGKAGLKDKQAITTQTFSVLFDKEQPSPEEISIIVEEKINVKVNWAKYHKNKLRAGHLKGNHFKIIISDPIVNSIERTQPILEKISKIGLPNYYGSQRLGENGENIIQGWLILKRKKRLRDRWLRKYLLSSYQSYLCNLYLSERVKKGLFNTLINGDLAKKHDTGGIFFVEDLKEEQKRFNNKEVSYTAPMYGYKMKQAKLESLKLEKIILKRESINLTDFKKSHIKGTRRLGRILPEIKIRKINEGFEFSFDLPKGSFATIVLREFTKNDLFLN